MSPKKTLDSSNAFRPNKKETSATMGKLPLILILSLVVVAFVVAPLFSRIGSSSGGNYIFGTYGDKKIDYSQGSYFYSQVNLLNNMYRDQISQSQDMFDFYRYYIWSSAYQQAVQYAAKTYELEKSGYTLSDRGMSRQIIQSGYFNDDQGNFDEAAYATATDARKKEIRESLMDSAYLNRFNSDRLGGIYRSPAEKESLINTSPVEKQFRYVFFSSSQYPEQEVLAYGRSHSDMFAAYPLSRITVADKGEADKIIKSLKSGEKSFAEAATASSTDMYSAKGGDMGDVYRYSLIDELGEDKTEAVLSLGVGEFSSEAIETDYGWYIYSVTGAPVAPDFTQDSLKTAVRNWMNWNEASTIDSWVMDEADAFIASVDSAVDNSFTLEAVKKGFEVKNTDFFPLNWGSSPLVGTGLSSADDSIIQGAAQSDDFFTIAFSLEEAGEISSPILLDSGVLVLELMGSRDSESLVTEYTMSNQLQQTTEGIYGSLVTESPLYQDNFMSTYYQIFPPESTKES
jgi:hypothetical protein